MLKQLISCSLAMATIFSVSAQQKQKTGDVVAYFGQERVEKVDEGVVAYNFADGYFLPKTAMSGYIFQMGDALAWESFTNNFKNPYSGNLEAVNYGRTRDIVQWTPIKIDETGRFKDRKLRDAYLYSEYTAKKSEIMLLQATGGTRTIVNGMPHEGDHYDFGYTLIPFKTNKGVNQFIFTPGRFGYVEAKVIKPSQPVMFTKRDMTLSDIIIGEDDEKWSAIRVVNASEKGVKDLTIRCELESGENATYATESIIDMTVRKLPFLVPATKETSEAPVKAVLSLLDKSGKLIDTTHVVFQRRSGDKIHERTFRSRVDGSVQYFSVNPSTTKGEGQALVLSVHGASVEARNQARAYRAKDWAYIIAATNRRPYGYNWEEWGRIDALEVFEVAKELYKTAPEKSYLTGHSMGGHGTWIIGATYPDKFAAIAPCAGYADIVNYVHNDADDANENSAEFQMIKRGANGGRSLDLKRNYLQSGVFIHHGGADRVVPVDQARFMRKVLADFHPDFAYHEEPGGSHWYSGESVDFKPLFDYFKWHTIPQSNRVDTVEFHTASPGISATNHWVTIEQQDASLEFSNVNFVVSSDTIKGSTTNVAAFSIDFSKAPISGGVVLAIDGQAQKVDGKGSMTFKKDSGKWIAKDVLASEKNPLRSGSLKSAFDNDVVFVYATAGSKAENEWYRNKARFDAENFLYRGNASVDIVSDVEFANGDFTDRNVIIYGNAVNNTAWDLVLSSSAPRVESDKIIAGGKVYSGDDLGTYYVYPRKGSDKASVGVIGGTGIAGAKATYPNDYLTGFTGYPDIMIFSIDVLRDGVRGVKYAGFFDNNWNL